MGSAGWACPTTNPAATNAVVPRSTCFIAFVPFLQRAFRCLKDRSTAPIFEPGLPPVIARPPLSSCSEDKNGAATTRPVRTHPTTEDAAVKQDYAYPCCFPTPL